MSRYPEILPKMCGSLSFSATGGVINRLVSRVFEAFYPRTSEELLLSAMHRGIRRLMSRNFERFYPRTYGNLSFQPHTESLSI